MKHMTVRKSSVFPAAKDEVFTRLRRLETLRYIAKPYATFTPTDGNDDLTWEAGRVFSFCFHMFGFMPLGVHTIHVIAFSEDGVLTHESNPFVPIWNHRIILHTIDAACTGYTDEAEIGAGWKTPFVYLWAKAFYAHRQRKWRRLLK